jgi:hypothetical protein
MPSTLVLLRRKAWLNLGLWRLATVAALAAIPWTNYQTLHESMQQIRLGALDGRGTLYLFNAGTFEDEMDMHLDAAEQACETIFNRHPEGLDFEARVDRLFNAAKRKNGTTCAEEVFALVAKDADIFRNRQIHQKFEMTQIPGAKAASEEIRCDNNAALVAVHGQIVRTGMFSGSMIPQSQYVTVFVELIPNSDAAHNGKYAMVVSNFKIQYVSQLQTAAR